MDPVENHLRVVANLLEDPALKNLYFDISWSEVAKYVNTNQDTLARTAAANYPGAYLAQCTLVTTFEPCAMCAGTIYWAGIGRVLYGAEETALLALTGDHPENPTLALPCRTVFASGQRPTEVLGPVPALQDEITALHRDFWR